MVRCGASEGPVVPCDHCFFICKSHRGCRQNEPQSDIVEYQLVLPQDAPMISCWINCLFSRNFKKRGKKGECDSFLVFSSRAIWNKNNQNDSKKAKGCWRSSLMLQKCHNSVKQILRLAEGFSNAIKPRRVCAWQKGKTRLHLQNMHMETFCWAVNNKNNSRWNTQQGWTCIIIYIVVF